MAKVSDPTSWLTCRGLIESCNLASHLMDNERTAVIKASREALDEAGFESVPLLVGTGGGSAKHTLKLAKEAKEAGADYSIVITPGYFAFAMASNKAAIKGFFDQVLDNSALPVMIYNFPYVVYGLSFCLYDMLTSCLCLQWCSFWN